MRGGGDARNEGRKRFTKPSAYVPSVLAPRVPRRARALAGNGAEETHRPGLLRDVPDARVVSRIRRIRVARRKKKRARLVRVRSGDVRAAPTSEKENDVDFDFDVDATFRFPERKSPRRLRLRRRGRAPVHGHASSRGAVSVPGREARGAAAEPSFG